MTSLLQTETSKYVDIWKMPSYREHSPGMTHARDLFEDVCHPKAGDTVIDFGCGAGKGGLYLREEFALNVTFLDFVKVDGVPTPFIQQSLWEEIHCPPINVPWKYGFCCDVMEHLPPQFTMLAVRNMLDVCEGVFFSVSFLPDSMGKFVGETLHLTLENFEWWRDVFAAMGTVRDARDLLGEGVFYVSR